MSGHPLSSALLALRRTSERLVSDDKMESGDRWSPHGESNLVPPMRALRRPLRATELAESRRNSLSREAVDALMFAVEHGDRQTKEAAELLVYSLIGRTMMARLLDPQRGPIPRFVTRIEKSVESFKEKIH